MPKQRLQDDTKAALKGGDKRRLAVLRLVMAAIKQREVDERIELDDAQVLQVLDKMLKQRRDSLTQYRQAGRSELAEQEEYEIAVIQEYLPEALSEAEIAELVDAAITAAGASSLRDMGAVMASLRPRVQGRADMAAVSALVKQKLSA